MRIIPRGEIPLKPARSVARITPEGWVFHWVGSKLSANPSEAQSKQTLINLQNHAFNTGYNDIPYNFAVDLAGRIFELRGWDRANGANGTSSANSHAWSVCSMSGPGNAMTESEKNAVLWLTQEGARRKAAVSYVKPHREVRGVSTACPGDDRAAFTVVATQKLHAHEAPAPRPPTPTPVPPTPTTTEVELMLISAPKRQQKTGAAAHSHPAYVRLDVNAKVIVGHNGAKLAEKAMADSGDSAIYKLAGKPIGWLTVDGETILVAIEGTLDTPQHFHFKQ